MVLSFDDFQKHFHSGWQQRHDELNAQQEQEAENNHRALLKAQLDAYKHRDKLSELQNAGEQLKLRQMASQYLVKPTPGEAPTIETPGPQPEDKQGEPLTRTAGPQYMGTLPPTNIGGVDIPAEPQYRPYQGTVDQDQVDAQDAANAKAVEQASAVAGAKPLMVKPGESVLGAQDKEGNRKPIFRSPFKPAAESVIQVHTIDEDGNPVTQVIPKSEASGKTYVSPEGAVIRRNEKQANASLQVGTDILTRLKAPETVAVLGPLMGRYKTLEQAAGAGDPTAVRLKGELMGFSAMQLQIHGSRAYKIAEDVNNLLNTNQTPEALAAGLDGILTASRVLSSGLKTGAKPPKKDENQASDEGEWIDLGGGMRARVKKTQ